MIQEVKKEFEISPEKGSTYLYSSLYSHNMRSIFSKILMSADLGTIYLDNPENRGDLKELLEIIREQVIRGNQIITNLNKLSILDNEIQLIKSTKVHDILEDSIHYIKKSNKINNISIKVESSDKNVIVQANDLLKDIFENIMINAINYNDSPVVEIYIKIEKEFDLKQGYMVRIEFIDNGIGIPDSQKKLVFNKVGKLKGGKGLGLGLSLVKQIVVTFNGKIWVEDRIRGDHTRGCKFILLLPEN